MVFFLDIQADPTVLLCCRYFVETKTLWEYLNSPAATTLLLRPYDIACIGEKFTGMASMLVRSLRCDADHAWPCLRRLSFDVAQQACPPRDTLFRFSGF